MVLSVAECGQSMGVELGEWREIPGEQAGDGNPLPSYRVRTFEERSEVYLKHEQMYS